MLIDIFYIFNLIEQTDENIKTMDFIKKEKIKLTLLLV